MTLPLLEYNPTTQNQRVRSFGTVDANEDVAFIYRLEDASSPNEMDALIQAAYRQVFNEQELLRFNRQTALETQLRNRSISVRDFIRGLAKSERFYQLVVAPNNNYRLVEMCLKRLLGRKPYSKDEEIAWSIQIGTQGLDGFIDSLIDSEEYSQTFGDNVVPYQRKRMGDRPFSFTPRYGEDYRDQLPQPKPYEPPFDFDRSLQQASWTRISGVLIIVLGLVLFSLAIAGWSSNIGG